MRLSPVTDPKRAEEVLIQKLTENPPYNSQIKILKSVKGLGWCMKEPKAWVTDAINSAGAAFFDGKPTASYGEGGSIPFLKELENLYP